jgi:hypothetical protein
MFSWLRNLIDALRRWLFGARRRDRFASVVLMDATANASKELGQGKLVLVGSEEKQKWLRFECPCGCREILALNLMKSHTPHWTVTRHDDGTVSVHPSVDATTCGSHFWIRRNDIQWV